MNRPRMLAVLVLGFLVVVGGILIAVYLLLGSEGDSVDVPVDEVVTLVG